MLILIGIAQVRRGKPPIWWVMCPECRQKYRTCGYPSTLKKSSTCHPCASKRKSNQADPHHNTDWEDTLP